jgi:hypothetical protein
LINPTYVIEVLVTSSDIHRVLQSINTTFIENLILPNELSHVEYFYSNILYLLFLKSLSYIHLSDYLKNQIHIVQHEYKPTYAR